MKVVDRVKALPSTTFCGRRFTRQQIIEIADTVSTCSNLSRQELALTICEHLEWRTPGNALKVNSALELLAKLESLEICEPPRVKSAQRHRPIAIKPLVVSADPLPLHSDLVDVLPVILKVVDSSEERQRFNSLMSEHHYLGYKRAFGAHLCYFILDRNGRELGLLLFAASAWSLKARDEWLGWEKKHRIKRLHLIVANSRFLIFPWIKVPNLASKVLSLVTVQLADDWQARYSYRPVLIETFVDRTKFIGTCYQAANWHKVGQSSGRGRFDESSSPQETIKDIYLQPLSSNFRDILLRGEAAIQTNRVNLDMPDKLSLIHDNVLSFWTTVAPLIRSIAAEFDSTWQVKRRVIDSMLLVLLIFRLVATRAKHGYGTTIDELWDNCRKQGIPLPQKKPIAASAFTVARLKLDEQIFKVINTRVIHHYEKIFDRDEYKFFGHRLYAIDGSKLNLPRNLIQEGFKTPNDDSYYPQGLLSGLYRLKAQIPIDFNLENSNDERRAALKHLSLLAKDDIVIYDRGYFSYGMLHAHLELGLNAVFRLSKSNHELIENFFVSGDVDRIVFIEPNGKVGRKRVRRASPGIVIKPLAIRLIKYEIEKNSYYLGTTLLDERYPLSSFPDLYHGRWGIEELYKISKHLIGIEEFHAKSLRGVQQELFANMVLITLNRIMTNHTDDTHKDKNSLALGINEKKKATNFKNSMAVVGRNLESLFIGTVEASSETLIRVLTQLIGRFQTLRPNRSYPRRSRKPNQNWKSSNGKPKKEAA